MKSNSTEKVLLAQLKSLAATVRAEVDQVREAEVAKQTEDDGFRNTPYKGPKVIVSRAFRKDCASRTSAPSRIPWWRKGYKNEAYRIRPGEVRMTEFVSGEMKRLQIGRCSVYERLRGGWYGKGVVLRTVSPKVVFVKVKWLPKQGTETDPRPNEKLLKDFVACEAERLGESMHCIYMRIQRGRYPELKFRKANRCRVFVRGFKK